MTHIEKIDALIPAAEKEAKQRVKLLGRETDTRPGVDGLPVYWYYFSEFFHEAMNRMAIGTGLRRGF